MNGLFAVERTITDTGPPMFALAPYGGSARRLVIAYKDRGRRELAETMGHALSAALPRLAERVPELAAGVPALSTLTPGKTPASFHDHSTRSARCGISGDNRSGSTVFHSRPSVSTRGAGGISRPGPPPIVSGGSSVESDTPQSGGSPLLWLVPAPSRAGAIRRRGGNHVTAALAVAATALAVRGVSTGLAPALRLTSGARDSVGLNATARAANLDGRVVFHSGAAPPRGASVVLVDDVITTGATVATCAAVLAAAGHRVHAVLGFTATV
ncbi:MAG: hypothetical protein M3443_04395 [Actinomycetota bacterium]|nr:hypothetical protein [Actinomycetota bacterium]